MNIKHYSTAIYTKNLVSVANIIGISLSVITCPLMTSHNDVPAMFLGVLAAPITRVPFHKDLRSLESAKNVP